MTTIATMTGDTDDAAEPDTAETAASAARPRRTQTAPAHTDAAYGAQQRSALVPVLATVIGALIIGVFSIAAVGFNVLRNDMDSVRTDLRSDIDSVRTDLRSDIDSVRTDLRSDIDSVRTDLRNDIDSVRTDLDRKITDVRTDVDLLRDQMEAGFAQVDQRFAQVNTVLLDHTDRLARIETVHGAHTHTTAQP